MPKVTVCMIVKDERDTIARAISSTRLLDPQYVVVDTGSTDGTPDILRSLGIEPLHFDWVDDFAQARNFALSHATGDWVLSIDGDEVLSQADWLGLLERNPFADCYRIEKRSYNDDNLLLGYRECKGEYPLQEYGSKGYLSEPNDLLFRNLRGLVWEGAVHETIGRSLSRLGKSSLEAPKEFVLHNYGRKGSDTLKSARYLKLAAKRLESGDQSDPVSWYYAGLAAMDRGDLEVAEELFAKSIALLPSVHAVFYMAKTQLSLGKLSLAEQGFVSFLRSRPKEFPAWAGLFTAVLKRGDQDRLDYYVLWAEKAGMGTRDVYKLAAYVSNKLENFGKGRGYDVKAEKL